MNEEYKMNNFDNDPYNDPYNESQYNRYSSDSIITFFQVFLGLLSFSGAIQVFYVNCKGCYDDYLKNKKIKKRKIKEDELILSECSICLENYNKGDKISILSCGHYYHSECLNRWIEKKEECPLCRIEI